MSTLRHFLERWSRSLLFIAWIWGLASLLMNGRYTAFLLPEFGYVLALGVFILLGFLMTAMTEMRQRRMEIAQVMHLLIFLLPLIYLWNAQGASLNAYAFQKRSLGLPVVDAPNKTPVAASENLKTRAQSGKPDKTVVTAMKIQKRSLPHPVVNASDKTPVGASENLKTRAQSGKSDKTVAPAMAITILDLYYHPDTYTGKRVKLIGMLHKKDLHFKNDSGKYLLVVFRFVITCCAADASPTSVLVDGKDLPDLAESSWVEVEGKFKMQEKDGLRVPILEKSTIKQTEAPEQPYLSPY